MVMDCYNKLKKTNKYKEIVMEVPCLSRCIDMVLVDKNDQLISIEFKISNWRRALEQAEDHKYGVNKAYICIPRPKRAVSRELIELSQQLGIGIFLYDSFTKYPFTEIVEPDSSGFKWEPRITRVKKLVNMISGRDVFQIS